MNCKHIWSTGSCTGSLVYVKADEPYHPGYYICEVCDSTYNNWEFMKQVYALSWHKFCATMEHTGVTDDNVESKDKTALIEIMGEQDLLSMPHHFKKDHPNVLRLLFDDVDEPYKVFKLGSTGDEPYEREFRMVVPMTKEQGQQILDFIKKNKDVGNFMVHCAAGVSRSAAVAKFITEYFGGEDKDFYKLNPYTHPNARILTILRNLSQANGQRDVT